MEAIRRNLPGWSLARDAPRPKEKQGWECPAPSVADWEDYKKWKADQERKDELPAGPQMFLPDTDLLFYQDPDVQLPWVHRLKCELPRRVGRLSGDLPVRASYVGFAREDADACYEVFKEAMARINVVLCRHIHHPPNRFELAHLEQSDLVLVDGGDRRRLWETLGTDLGSSQVAEHVKWRYLQGALVVAVGEAMSLLGAKSWYMMEGDKGPVAFTGWKIFPYIVASEEERGVDLEDMVSDLGGAGVVILGIHAGGGMLFNRDGLVEPVRHMITEYRWDWQSESVKRALLLGPPRGTGLLCPLYAAMKEREGDEEGEANVWAYALTQEEEQEEEHLFEHFDTHSMWVTPASRAEVETLKKQGNEAFKVKKADLASLNYMQALAQLQSSASYWSELADEDKRVLDSLDTPGGKPKDAAQGAKEDHRVSTLRLSLLLNTSACHQLAFDQDMERQRAKEAQSAAKSGAEASVVEEPGEVAEAEPSDDAEGAMTLVEVRDNLVMAFRAANDALDLSGGRSAKAWFRRGCAFERLRDPRNAARDFEDALLRAPGDKAISTRRDEAVEAAGKVAEGMYYARHRELDAQEARLGLGGRRSLSIRGAFRDAYVDERKEFSVAQPLARVAASALEEIDGKPQLIRDDSPDLPDDAPYLHAHALWTWEFLVQRAPGLQLLHIADVDLGSGPLEWLCKGLRTHAEVKVLHLEGVHLGAQGGKMMRNVLAQNTSLIEVTLNACALHDAGFGEVAEGLSGNTGPLETLSLRRNNISPKRLGKLAAALTERDNSLSLTELDLSENALGVQGAKEISRIISSDEHRLRHIVLQESLIDLAAFWRLVNNLNDSRPLAKLDLRRNPIGRGTRRIWRGTMGPTIRCEVLFTDHPIKALKEARRLQADDSRALPLPRLWA